MNKSSENKKEKKGFLTGAKNVFSKYFKLNLSHNKGTKVFSLLLAIFFWFFVMDQVDPEITRVFENIPVNFINQQDLEQNNLKIMNQYDYLVNVEVKGRRNDVLNMTAKNINLWADMRTVRGGINNVYINRNINSDTVTIKEVLPNEIVLTVERIVSVPKQIKVIYNDSFQDHYYEIEKTIKPEEIRVVGPESVVNSVEYLGAYVNVGTFTNDVEKDISLAPYNSEGKIVNGVSLDKVSTTLSIKMGLEKSVAIDVDLVGEPADQTQITSIKTNPESILIYGPALIINEIENIITEPIELTGNENSKYTVNTKLVMPDKVTNTLENGVQVEVQIEPIIEREFVFNANEIVFQMLASNLKIENMDAIETVTVKVRGIQSMIDALEKNHFTPSISFADVKQPGNYKLLLKVSQSDEYTIDVQPETIEFSIVEN